MKSFPEMFPAQDLVCQWGDCIETFMDPEDLYVLLFHGLITDT